MEFPTRLLSALLAAAVAGSALAQRTPDDALRALQEGNQRFASDRSVPQPLGEGVRRTLARGQSPFAAVLTCADSQVPPEHLFNAGLGELHVVRVGAHVADAESIASLEYAVEHLNVSLCVVLAHENCGAIATGIASIGNEQAMAAPSPAMQHLLESIEPAVRKVRARDLGGSALQTACEEEHAHAMVHECLRRSALLRRYAQVGRFKLVPARLHQQSGEVEWLPPRPLPSEPSEQKPMPLTDVPMGAPPHVALRLLQAGHRRFLRDGKPAADLSGKRREQLMHGQQPLAIVLCCDDSRTVPEHVFDQGLGELFVVRLSGNALSDSALATIEYAASQLGASLLVVMGHTECAAITAAVAAEPSANASLSPNQRALLLRLAPSIEAARKQGKSRSLAELALRGHVQRTAIETRSRSRLLRQLEETGRFAVLASIYDTATGDLEWLKDSSEGKVADKHEPVDTGKPLATADHATDHHAADTPRPPGEKAQLPVLDWAADAAPHGETKPHGDLHTKAHGDAAPPGNGHGDSHDAGPRDAHGDAHGDSQQANPTKAAAVTWKDPVVLVGITGVVSLLLAAVLAMKR